MLIKEITDQEVWDKFVNFHLLQSWNWGEFQKVLGKRVYRFGVYGDNSELIVVFQAFEVQSKFFRFLYLPNAPVFKDNDPFDKNNSFDLTKYKDILEKILLRTKNIAQEMSLDFIKVDPLFLNIEKNVNLLRSLGFVESPIETQAGNKWLLDLRQGDKELLSQMNKTTKYSITRALTENLIANKATYREFDRFWNLFSYSALQNRFTTNSQIYHQTQFNFLKSKNEYEIFYINDEKNQMHAAIAVSFYKKVASYLHSCSLKSKEIPIQYASRLLLWEAIKEAKNRGCEYFDFYGIARNDQDKTDPWYGFTDFKKSFGGFNITMLKTYDFPNKKFRYFFYLLSENFRKIRRKFRN